MSESVATEARPSVAGFAPGAVGVTAPSNPDHQGAFLTDVIAGLGFADRDSVANAVEVARNSACTPEDHLLESGALGERQLSLALAERNGLDHVDLDRFEVDPEAVAMIGKSTAARYTALPIAFASDGALLVAIEDTYNMLGISDIEVMTRSEVRPVIAAGTQIRRLIDQLPEGAPPPPSEPAPPPPEPPLPPPEPPPPPSEPAPAAVQPDRVPHQPDPEVAAPPDPAAESDGSESSGGEEVDAELEELSAALATLREKMRDAGDLLDAVKRGRRQSAKRERKLEKRLSEAQERVAALEESEAKRDTAVELADAATEKLAELRGVLEEGRS